MKRWIFFIPVIIGIIAIVLLKQNSSVPKQKPSQELAIAVRTIEIPPEGSPELRLTRAPAI